MSKIPFQMNRRIPFCFIFTLKAKPSWIICYIPETRHCGLVLNKPSPATLASHMLMLKSWLFSFHPSPAETFVLVQYNSRYYLLTSPQSFHGNLMCSCQHSSLWPLPLSLPLHSNHVTKVIGMFSESGMVLDLVTEDTCSSLDKYCGCSSFVSYSLGSRLAGSPLDRSWLSEGSPSLCWVLVQSVHFTLAK